jgi:hypothetical protein
VPCPKKLFKKGGFVARDRENEIALRKALGEWSDGS